MHPPMRIDRLDEILDQVVAHPETHYQGAFVTSCGTRFCIAGWACFNALKASGMPDLEIPSYIFGGLPDPVCKAVEWLEMTEAHGVKFTYIEGADLDKWVPRLFSSHISLADVIHERNRLAALQGEGLYKHEILEDYNI